MRPEASGKGRPTTSLVFNSQIAGLDRPANDAIDVTARAGSREP